MTPQNSLTRLANVPVKRMKLATDGKVSYAVAESAPELKMQFTSFENLTNFFNAAMVDLPLEEFWVVALNSANKPICAFQLEQGIPGQAVVYPQKVMRGLILANAAAFVVGHNHPSGEARPSMQDKDLTRALQAAGQTLQIRMLDHIIVTPQKESFSFRKEGLL